MLDEELRQMESAARAVYPRNTDGYDYANYHTLSEVRTFVGFSRCYLGEI